jgi:predicted esterase
MSISFSSVARRAGVVCLVVVSSLATVFVSHAAAATDKEVARRGGSSTSAAKPHGAVMMSAKSIESAAMDSKVESAPVKIAHEGHSFLAYAPTNAKKQNSITVVYLHGVNGRAENGCPHFRSGASEVGWLVCPEGVQKDESTRTASWGGDVVKQGVVVSRALKAAESKGASKDPGVAVGFSQGSYVALDLVKTNLGHFRGLVLIAAPEAHPSAQKLQSAGIKRVVLAAGSRDHSHDALVEDVKRLQSEGMDARFVDLGNIGHTYATEDNALLHDAIVWAAGNS